MKLEPGQRPYTALCVLESEKGKHLKNRAVEEIDVAARNKNEAKEKIEKIIETDYVEGLIIHKILDSTSVAPMMFF